MRTIVALAAAAALAACTSAGVERSEAPPHEPGKAVAFYANNNADFNRAASDADEWCRETYNEPASYLHRRTTSEGSVVTFGCMKN
jgi:hypothetical protein